MPFREYYALCPHAANQLLYPAVNAVIPEQQLQREGRIDVPDAGGMHCMDYPAVADGKKLTATVW